MALKVTPTRLPGVLVVEPRVFEDARGSFFESFNARVFAEATGVDATFVQDNQSSSLRNVLRGLHYQVEKPQGKLVRVLRGAIFDVAVDLRRSAPTFGQWVGVELTAENRRQLWVPPGFGHGFLATSDVAEVAYKTTEYWYGAHDRSLRWNDPLLGIDWPLDGEPLLAAKDIAAPLLADAELY